MNYYHRHLGDYAKDTAHLSMLEHGAYTLLLDRYYSTEQGIPEDQAHRVARARTKEERAAVDTVLAEFFTLSEGVWTNGRTEEEIEKMGQKVTAARTNGTKGGRPKKNPEGTEEKPTGFSVGSDQLTQEKALQSPIAITPIATTLSSKAPLSLLPSVEGSGSAQIAAPPTPPPPFDGTNDKTLNGKSVVPLAASFDLPEQWGIDAECLGFKPGEVLLQAEKFRQYWTAGKGTGTRRSVKGWRQSWSNWLDKAAKDAR